MMVMLTVIVDGMMHDEWWRHGPWNEPFVTMAKRGKRHGNG